MGNAHSLFRIIKKGATWESPVHDIFAYRLFGRFLEGGEADTGRHI